MCRAFTLIELLVIVAIISAMAGVGLVSVQSGRGAARVKGATRDIFAAIRQARSLALVSQKPVVVTYATTEVDGEVCAKIDIESAKLFKKGVDRSAIRTLNGDPLPLLKEDPVATFASATNATTDASDEGTLIGDVLFAPIDEDVVKGMRIKVLMADEELDVAQVPRKSKISVFSNVDYILGKYKEKTKARESEAKKAEESTAKDDAVAKDENQAPVSVVWETNGRVDPHTVWVYADGQRPEQGLQIRIDRFGAAKVLMGDGRDGE